MSKLLNLLGTKPNQIPTNSDLGKMAFQDALSLTDDNATTSSCYPLFTDPTNGALVKTSLSKLTYTPSTGTLRATSFATASGSLVVDWKNVTAQYSLHGGGTVTTGTTGILWSARVIAIPVEMPEESASGFFDINCPISGTVTYYNASNVTTTLTCDANGIPLNGWEAIYYQITEGQSATYDQTKFRVVNYQNSTWVPGPGWICIVVRNGDDSSFKWLPGQVNIPPSSTYNSSTGACSWIVSGGGGGGATLSSVAASTTYYIGLSPYSTSTWTDARVDTVNLYYTSGDNTLYATNFNTASDINLKENIQKIDNSLDILTKLQGVSFNWKSTGNKSYGLIAQELETVLPELVNTVDGVKSIAYTALIGILLEAIKELNEKLENK
jgi:hypothetical protein